MYNISNPLVFSWAALKRPFKLTSFGDVQPAKKKFKQIAGQEILNILQQDLVENFNMNFKFYPFKLQ